MDLKKDIQTDLLLETIRKELNAIINDSESQTKGSVQSTNTLDAGGDNKIKTQTSSSSPSPNKSARQPTRSDNVSLRSNRIAPAVGTNEPPTEVDTIQRAALLDHQSSQSIDEDLQKMRIDLMQSYELFQTIGDKFESINFGQLKNRIKDLHLSSNKNEATAAAAAAAATARTTSVASELNDLFEQSYVGNRLDKLTGVMGEKFRKHPGEFGDIPELSAFFKACTQLQHGLEQLKKQRNEASDLGKRMCWAAEVSYDRIDEIRKSMGEQRAAAVVEQKPREGDSG